MSTKLTERNPRLGGTPWYLPPEFVEERGQRGTPGDIFALGVVMLYVLGRLPLPERHPKRLCWKIHEALVAGSEAANTMYAWLVIIDNASRDLDASVMLERLVARMVIRESSARVALDKLVEESAALPQNG